METFLAVSVAHTLSLCSRIWSGSPGSGYSGSAENRPLICPSMTGWLVPGNYEQKRPYRQVV